LKAKEVNIFNYLNQIFYKTDKHEYDKKLAPAYMLSMWLSHDSKLIDIVNNLNCLQFSLKDGIIYKYYMSKVPKGKRFLKWSKKTPKDKKFDKDVANEMDNNKHLSKREAMMVTKMRGVLNDE
jgi:hypothetical protein